MASRDEMRTKVRAFAKAHPGESLAAVARHFGLTARKVQRWCADDRNPEVVATPKRLPAAEELSPDVQSKVRRALMLRLDFLADPENLQSTRAKDIAITLGILADKWGGVMRATGTNGAAAGVSDAEIERLERKYGPGPRLQLVEEG